MDTKGYIKDAQAFFEKDAPVIIRMRGLPYDCTAEEVLQFFEHGENHVKVMDGKDGVFFLKNRDGKTTGDALVLLTEEDMAPKALKKNNEHIGSRYIELCRISTPEVQRLVSWSMDKNALHYPTPDPNQQVVTFDTEKNCLRLRGLPFEVQIENIIEFLGEHTKNVIPHGLHFVTDEGMLTGEAFIQMNSASSAFNAAQEKHLKFLLIGTKCRYIQVEQCSRYDMSRILASEQSALMSAVSPVARIQSPLGSISPALSLPLSANASNSSAEFYPVTAAASPLPPQQLATPHQDKIWLLNYLVAAQQQQQAAALYQQQLLDLAKNVPPPQLPLNPSNLWAQNSLTYPSLFPTAAEPFFYINIPPPQPQAAAAGYPQYSAGYPQYVPQPYVPSLSPQLYLPSIPPPVVTAPNPVLDLKRSWDQAFPGTDVNGNLVKRPAATSTSTATFYNNSNNYMAGYPNTPGFQAPM